MLKSSILLKKNYLKLTLSNYFILGLQPLNYGVF